MSVEFDTDPAGTTSLLVRSSRVRKSARTPVGWPSGCMMLWSNSAAAAIRTDCHRSRGLWRSRTEAQLHRSLNWRPPRALAETLRGSLTCPVEAALSRSPTRSRRCWRCHRGCSHHPDQDQHVVLLTRQVLDSARRDRPAQGLYESDQQQRERLGPERLAMFPPRRQPTSPFESPSRACVRQQTSN